MEVYVKITSRVLKTRDPIRTRVFKTRVRCFYMYLTWTEIPRGATEIESYRLDFWPPFKIKWNALKRHFRKQQRSFKLSPLSFTLKLTHSPTH